MAQPKAFVLFLPLALGSTLPGAAEALYSFPKLEGFSRARGGCESINSRLDIPLTAAEAGVEVESSAE
jgi:hypothetical protein